MQAAKPFPPEYNDDPKRRAERRIYLELLDSGKPGLFIYEWKRDKKSTEVDFLVWIPGVGLFAIQAKGGRYKYERDQWYLLEDGRWQRKPSPLVQTWRATDALMKALPKHQGYKSFVFPVLLFTDMDPDPAIESRAKRDKTYVEWDERGLVDNLADIARERGVYYPPTDDTIATDAHEITDGEVIYERADRPEFSRYEADRDADLPATGLPELGTDYVGIRHVEHLHQTIHQNLHFHFHGPITPEDATLLQSILDQGRGLRSGD